ncbi:MAG: SGNH/GDSL hydrolase family protein [Deltaproteobacteria bacterium]|nr:MAG: SGNH/GDSL hydrolase family protein [Deltaproteobacteria bacterium]
MKVRAIRRLLGFCLFLAVTAVSLEVGARLFFARSAGPRALLYGTPWHRNVTLSSLPRQDMQVHDDARQGYTKYFPREVKWGVDDRGRFPIRINNHGFRGPDFSTEKPPDVLRVLTLGASSTFGFGNRDDETYPHLLEEILNRRAAGTARFEVINFAIPHATTTEIVSMFRAEGVELRPDFVTLYEGVNDAKAAFMGTAYGGLWGVLGRRLMLVELVNQLRPSLGGLPADAWSDQVAAGASERFLANAAALRDDCRRAGAHLIVASQQAKSELVEREQMRGLRYEDEVKLVQESLRPGAEGSEWRTLVRGTDDPNDPRTPRLVRRLVEAHFGGIFLIHARIMRDLREWAAANSVDFVDVIQILDPDRDHLTSWVHLDREANQRVAEALAARILTLPEAASRGVDP